MSKKRLRIGHQPTQQNICGGTKSEARYWRKRLFKGIYTYKGRRFKTRNWSVKIQHQGRRKTFTLSSGRRAHAAAEACQLYRTILDAGWAGFPCIGGRKGELPRSLPGVFGSPDIDRFRADYWAQRLIEREYAMSLRSEPPRELSVRMDHGGTSHYFPLGTADSELAAKRALRIYQSLVRYGWETVNKRFRRELTVAFRWLESPLAWTYTTIHTQTSVSASCGSDLPDSGMTGCTVAIAESDAGIRQALVWCITHMHGLVCRAAFATAAEALRELPRAPARLVLVSHSLADASGAACLEQIKGVVPAGAGLLYSVYEDSEELFKTTPGGAGTYLLRRTPATQFLQPVAGLLEREQFSSEEMAAAAWQYFKDSFASPPIVASGPRLTNLTQREHEVLALLTKGHPDKDIADQLGISIHTVHEHVRNIFEKLGVHNRTEAAVKFLQK